MRNAAGTSRGSFKDGRYLEEERQLARLASAAARRYVSARCALGRTSCSVFREDVEIIPERSCCDGRLWCHMEADL